MPFALADKLHDIKANLKLYRHRVPYLPLRLFCASSKAFENTLRESEGEQYWVDFMRAVNGYRYLACSHPLPLDSPGLRRYGMTGPVRTMLASCVRLYPGLTQPSYGLVESLEALCLRHENPLLDHICEVSLHSDCGSAALLVLRPTLLKEVSDAVAQSSSAAHTEVVVPGSLRGDKVYDTLFVVGSAEWFPEHVFLSPRAAQIHIVQHEAVRDLWRPATVFSTAGSEAGWAGQNSFPCVVEMVPPSDASPEGGDLSPKELLPQVDYDAIIRIVQKAQPRKGKGEDEVEARLFLLADDRAVLLDAAEETTSLVLDLAQEQASRRIRRVSVGQVESGMFLLLRTQGAGDYIVEIADAMLGARRKELRELQTRWKQLLRDLVVSSGRDQVCQRLFRSGSTIANAMNLQNWISYRTIRPREKTDLSAIMACIGWSARADEVWEKMGHIDRAHRMAGHRIRKMLLKEVSHTNLHEMRSRSRLDFTIPNVESGSLSACLVEDTYKGTVTASERQLGQIFEREVGPMLELDFGTDTHLA